MVRCWAREFGPRGITVNVVAPGTIRTRLYDWDKSPESYQSAIDRIPLGRVGEPEDCVGLYLLLASDEGSFINGQVIEVSGAMQAV